MANAQASLYFRPVSPEYSLLAKHWQLMKLRTKSRLLSHISSQIERLQNAWCCKDPFSLTWLIYSCILPVHTTCFSKISLCIQRPPKFLLFELQHNKTNKRSYVPSLDWDQPGHLPSLIRGFPVCMKTHWAFSCPLRALQRLWSAQSDLSLRRHTGHFVGFVKLQLTCRIITFRCMFCQNVSKTVTQIFFNSSSEPKAQLWALYYR